MMTETLSITRVLDVGIEIGCRDSVGKSHVRRVKCVAVVNNTRVVMGGQAGVLPWSNWSRRE